MGELASADEMIELMVLNDRVRYLLESRYPKDAIQAAEALLEQVPDIVPILNNLSLSQFMVGDSDNLDLELKKAEAFAFLGDDEQVWAAYEQAKKSTANCPPCSCIWPPPHRNGWVMKKQPGDYGGKLSNWPPH